MRGNEADVCAFCRIHVFHHPLLVSLRRVRLLRDRAALERHVGSVDGVGCMIRMNTFVSPNCQHLHTPTADITPQGYFSGEGGAVYNRGDITVDGETKISSGIASVG